MRRASASTTQGGQSPCCPQQCRWDLPVYKQSHWLCPMSARPPLAGLGRCTTSIHRCPAAKHAFFMRMSAGPTGCAQPQWQHGRPNFLPFKKRMLLHPGSL